MGAGSSRASSGGLWSAGQGEHTIWFRQQAMSGQILEECTPDPREHETLLKSSGVPQGLAKNAESLTLLRTGTEGCVCQNSARTGRPLPINRMT